MLDELGIQLVRLDLPFRLNHVNCFLAEGENGWVVVDTGLHNDYTAARWEEELKGKQVTDIYITHYHPDHFGYAGGLQKKTEARLSMTKIDADLGLGAWEEHHLQTFRNNYELAGIPSTISKQLIDNMASFVPRVKPYPKVDHYMNEGERVKIGKYSYEVIFTPGHSDGLIVFYNQEKSVLLSTDHILPKITPNISYWFYGDPNPLGTYLQSLEKIRKLDVEIVIPSHGTPFTNANRRIDEIMAHHEELLEKLLAELANGQTVFEACKKLFSKIHNTHDSRFAIGETLAHLEYLRYKGECKREIFAGKYIYFRE
ncbi:MBL fold metallo-hydrolase [Caldibacillus sp. 210928-DFI.2.22]|uniref:MBL fold metallo-hydrolase n=1 Tax=unclassified Caldibacillus TaxID=2641266 RepID=UPI001D075A1A|nr:MULTISPECIES: MBL fold metallo-hydrolase [unclassified Caldibacillus]MCB7070581.1 MBL fold metallo-hydrolase [Caldibacillus sp. 210928-DFI.2.22]MCB7073711.1 MBL fold metallo-hydrolase [Caldibacillus sp. 210928-DFI.2.18]